MKFPLVLVLVLVLGGHAVAADETAMIIAVGAPGEEEFSTKFAAAAAALQKACAAAGATSVTIGLKPAETNSQALMKQTVERELATGSASPLWIALIGHGAFDGREAKFNLRGDDLTAAELATWLKPARRPLIIVNASASSAPFMQKLAGPGRVVITATRAGSEQNYAHFGEYFATALNEPKADLDKDGQTSLLEAFLSASRQTAEFFESEGRLATEHALLDDNGDGLGTQGDWFQGLRVVKKTKDGAEPDGLRAHQIHLVPSAAERRLPVALRAQRDETELALAQLRSRKTELPEDEYYTQLEALVLKLAELYERAEKQTN